MWVWVNTGVLLHASNEKNFNFEDVLAKSLTSGGIETASTFGGWLGVKEGEVHLSDSGP
jgi:hypothetical protein